MSFCRVTFLSMIGGTKSTSIQHVDAERNGRKLRALCVSAMPINTSNSLTTQQEPETFTLFAVGMYGMV